jgi:hypothetical protein
MMQMGEYYIYLPSGGDFISYFPQTGQDGSALRFYDAVPRAVGWFAIEIGTDNPHDRESDFPPFIGPTPLFSERAWEFLQPTIGSLVEALPVTTQDGKRLYAIHVLTIIENAIDLERSRAVTNPISRSISRIDQYALNVHAIGDLPIFKLKETRGLYVYLSGEFVRLISESPLVGFGCVPIPLVRDSG